MKNVKVETVYFINPVTIRTRNETRPERVLSHSRYDLEMVSVNWLLVVSAEGHRTWVPAHNISSIVELQEPQDEEK